MKISMCVSFRDEILIPKGDVGDFAVVACDQFSACPEYWNGLYKTMPKYSALDFILPECFLSEAEERIEKIKSASEKAIKAGRFKPVRGAVAVTRTTAYGRVRRGIVASIDLDAYEYKSGNNALIRASERTIEERIPPRVKIRNAIDIELPHILLLVDDPNNALISAADQSDKTPLYEGALKGGGGYIKGELISDAAKLEAAVNGIIESSVKKFGSPLFALVGDGNHSLATAKRCHEQTPTPQNGRALVEIINIYDEGLVCEPIHRCVRTDDSAGFIKAFRATIKGGAKSFVYSAQGETEVDVPSDKIEAINAVDAFCEEYVKKHGGSVEYVHGDDALKTDGCVGIRMRGIEKSELFSYVVKNGVLPKKTFSLGEAEEKRFYVEARRIK